MPALFDTLAEITAPETYKGRIKAALLRVGATRERFTYFEQFRFDHGTGPLLVPGRISPALLKQLAGRGQKPAHGFCTFAQDTGLSLVVTRGTVDQDRVQKSLRSAGMTCNVTVSAGTDQDGELEDLENAGVVSARIAQSGAALDAHLAGRTADDREAHARRALEMGEAATNADKAAGQPHAHSLSAHGPGTDQTPRIVAGHRADQVADGREAGTLPADVTLQATDGRAAAVPDFAQVGDAPSNVSSAFGSAVAMLAAVEEAFAQVAQVESFIAKELRHARDERRVMDDPAVRNALAALVAVRTRLEAAKARVAAGRTADARRGVDRADVAEVGTQADALDKAAAAFRAAREAAMAALPRNAPTPMADQRFVRTVEPGVPTGTSHATTEPALTKGEPIDAATMARRFESTTTTENLARATVVLDPAYVTGADGSRRRAGWQAQTAFPTTEGDDRRTLVQEEYVVLRLKERLAEAGASLKDEQDRTDRLKRQEADDLAKRKSADADHETAQDRVDEVAAGTASPADIRQAEAAREAAVAARTALNATRAALAEARASLADATNARNAVKARVETAEERLKNVGN